MLKLKEVYFKNPPFRKFDENMNIPIGERLTIIAGHNGIGKSTLLGFIANSSASNDKSYFGKQFRSQFDELFFLDPEKDYFGRGKNPSVFVKYASKKGDVVKRGSLSKTKQEDKVRVRLIPRTDLSASSQEAIQHYLVKPDGKIDIPTIYIGMSRLIPIGENQSDLATKNAKVDSLDADFMQTCFSKVMSMDVTRDIIDQDIKSKRHLLPKSDDFNTPAFSIGQDSFGSIVTALASFHKMKRESGDNYRGGILLIDEIEAGLHPSAQKNLFDLLYEESKKLKIQIIMTTHSLVFLESAYQKNKTITEYSDNDLISLVYIKNVKSPQILKTADYSDIKFDMLSTLRPKPRKKIITIFTEDEEAKYFIDFLLSESDVIIDFIEANNIKIDCKALGISCNEMMSIVEKMTTYLSPSVFAFDNDVLSEKIMSDKILSLPNTMALPGMNFTGNTAPSDRNPERILFEYINTLLANDNHDFWTVNNMISPEQIQNSLINSLSTSGNRAPRENNKQWFKDNKHHFDEFRLLLHFSKDYQGDWSNFENDCLKSLQYALNKFSLVP